MSPGVRVNSIDVVGMLDVLEREIRSAAEAQGNVVVDRDTMRTLRGYLEEYSGLLCQSEKSARGRPKFSVREEPGPGFTVMAGDAWLAFVDKKAGD